MERRQINKFTKKEKLYEKKPPDSVSNPSHLYIIRGGAIRAKAPAIYFTLSLISLSRKRKEILFYSISVKYGFIKIRDVEARQINLFCIYIILTSYGIKDDISSHLGKRLKLLVNLGFILENEYCSWGWMQSLIY